MTNLKKLLALLLALCMVFALAACGGDAAPAEETTAAEEAPVEEAPEEEYDPMVDCIDLAFDEGSLRYVSFEPANEGLTDEAGTMVFVFEYTNNETKPAQAQSLFRIQFFQNGVELDTNFTFSSLGGDQYDLVGAFFNEAMNGGTITFGRIIQPKDNSPITIMVSRNGGAEEEYQMMEVALDGATDAAVEEMMAAAGEAPAEVTPEEIEELLQGTWTLPGGSFTFDNGSISVDAGTAVMNGTYTINTADATIDASIQASDGSVAIHLPYTYENGTLTLFNNNGTALTKE